MSSCQFRKVYKYIQLYFRFTRSEIKHLYRIFKTECPSGSLTEEKFHIIFTSFFPWGDEPYQSKSNHITGNVKIEK